MIAILIKYITIFCTQYKAELCKSKSLIYKESGGFLLELTNWKKYQ